MKRILLLQLFLFTAFGFAQVGVNTTTPDPSSMLDISATNKGVLVPRVSLSNVTTTMLDGTNTAATGLLIWNTNAATVGGNGAGFYFFNGTQWMPITQTATTDHDIYEVGGTIAPDAITDNKYTQGTLTIGTNIAATGVLDVDNATKTTSVDINNTFATNPTGIDVNLTSNAAGKTGIKTQFNGTAATGNNSFIQNTDNMVGNTNRTAINNDFSGTSSSISTSITGLKNDFKSTSNYYAILYGVSNSFASTTNAWGYGMVNAFTNGGSTPSFGVVNAFNGTSTGDVTGFSNSSNNRSGTIMGLENSFSGTGDGIHFGISNFLNGTGTGTKYGVFNIIPSTAGGTHYGIYSDVQKSGSFAGYFLGNVSIGTSALNNYILPPSRGTNGQIMQTDGSGNVSWVTPTPTPTTDSDWFELGTTTTANNITDNIYTQGKVTVGSSTLSNGKLNVYNSLESNSFYSENTGSPAIATSSGYFVNNGIGTHSRYGIQTSVSGGGTGQKFGVFNSINTSSTDWQAGVSNFLSGSNASFVYGCRNDISTTGSAAQQQFGLYNSFSTVSDSEISGAYNFISSGGNGINYGTHNRILGNGNGVKYGTFNFISGAGSGLRYGNYNYVTGSGTNTKYGTYNFMDQGAGGIHYGLYSEALKTGSYAGYFLGNVSIGTTTTNNYILPPSRGTNGQTMQTDGSGNVTWVNSPTDTDDQGTDVFSLTGTTLNLSLQNDGVATQTVDLSSLKDADWYEVGGTNSPDSITDNKFTLGDISIGKITAASGKLDVDAALKNVTTSFLNNNTTTGSKWGIQNNVVVDTNNDSSYGISNAITGNADFKYGIYNTISGAITGGSAEYGLVNNHMSSGFFTGFGVFNFFNPSASHTGNYIGLHNEISGSNHTGGFIGVNNLVGQNTNSAVYGVTNSLGGTGSGVRAGVYNFFSGTSSGDVVGTETYMIATGTGNKYGERITIPNTLPGIHFGVYSDVTKTNSFAGYFLGKVSVGTNIIDNYVLPPSRGLNGQIMQTDGAGNVSWADAPSDADWYEVGGITPANSILDNIYTGGDVSIGKATAATGKVDIEADNKTMTLVLENNNATSGSKSGIDNSLTANANNALSWGILNRISGLSPLKFGVTNSFTNNNTGVSITEVGYNNDYTSTGNVNFVGHSNTIFPFSTNSGTITGYVNNVTGSVTGEFTGFVNSNFVTTNSLKTGLMNAFSGGGNGDTLGINNSFTGITNGEIIGVNTNINSSGTGLKYGEKITIDNTSGGIHCGIYADVTKANSYAGYFLGRVSIGNTLANNYILPASRGTNGQIMQTDGAGNVSWTNAPTADADWYEVGGTNPANAITDNIFTSGDVSIGKNTAATAKVDIDANTKLNTLSLENIGATVGTKNGISNSVLATINNNFSSCITNAMGGLALNKYAINNGFITSNSGATIFEYGINNNLLSSGNVSMIGSNNFFSPSGLNNSSFTGYNNLLTNNNHTGSFVGLSNLLSNATNNNQVGVSNFFTGGGNGIRYGIKNEITGNSNGAIYGVVTEITSTGVGNKYGETIIIDNTAPGTHYGILSEVTKANSYAGYFLGRVSIGTLTGNNYILPASRGTANQIMQTDGVGNVSWVNSNDWKLNGNTGTIAGTDFIGTTDAQDLDFRTNNVIKLKLTQQGQLSIQNTGGSVFVGAGAGDVDDLTNNQNTFIGTSSGQLTTFGNLNTALGHSSLGSNVDGLGNTGVGRSALITNVSGSNNTSIGRLSDVSVGTLTNATAVGFSATVNASNKIRLGNAAITVVEGQVAYTNPSDARFKFNVKEDVPGLDFIKKLKPVTYNFDTKKFDEHLNKNRNKDEVTNEDFSKSTAIVRTGFLAQDVEKICNDLGYNFDGLHIPDTSNPTDNYGIAYSQFIMPIVKAVQEQQVIIETQKTELEQLKSELEKYKTLEERIKALEQK